MFYFEALQYGYPIIVTVIVNKIVALMQLETACEE
jgi:hypothetical protein